MGILSNVGRQFGVVADAMRALLAAPQMLLYPVLAAVLGLGVPAAIVGLTYLVGGGDTVAYAGFASMLTFPVVFSFLMVAYCYEINEVFEGRRPAPGAGLRVAAGRLKLVALAGLVVGVGGFAVQMAGNKVPLGDAVGVASSYGLRIAGVFAFPVVATTQGSAREAFSEVVDSARDEWGKSLAATVGTQAIGMIVAWTGILAGIGLAVAAFLGEFAVDVGPLGPFTLPIVVAVGAILLAALLQFTVDGIVKVALYRYARDGELPPALSNDADALVETEGSGPTQSGSATPGGD